MDSIINEMPHPESIITNPAIATRDLADMLLAKQEVTNILFSGSRQSQLSEKIYAALTKYIASTYPNEERSLQNSIVLSIIIQGCFHAYQSFANDENRNEVTDILGQVGTCLKMNFLEN